MKRLLLVFLILSCTEPGSNLDRYADSISPDALYDAKINLKDAASFPIGNIVSANKLDSNKQFTSVLLKNFNSITAENDMKMRNIFIGPNKYDFSDGDKIVAFAKKHGLRVFGHTLIWHSSIPDWLNNFRGSDSEFEQLIKNYIKATVTHFAQQKMIVDGKEVSVVAGWDVVNEAFTSKAQKAIFRRRMGADYVRKCFLWAREADSQVKLFYNDYSLEGDLAKLKQVLSMIDEFRSKKIPLDGIGFQMHIDYQYPSLDQMKNNLQLVINKDILIHFSELDVTVNRNKDISKLTLERANSQKNRYKDITKLYLNIPSINRFGITLWGMRDVDSWLLDFYKNPLEYPLLFDKNYKTKISHLGFIEGLK